MKEWIVTQWRKPTAYNTPVQLRVEALNEDEAIDVARHFLHDYPNLSRYNALLAEPQWTNDPDNQRKKDYAEKMYRHYSEVAIYSVRPYEAPPEGRVLGVLK